MGYRSVLGVVVRYRSHPQRLKGCTVSNQNLRRLPKTANPPAKASRTPGAGMKRA